MQLSKTGELLTEETCTQRLQTFHKTKKLTSSPCKTQDLAVGPADLDYDPRPERFRGNKGYTDFVRNLVCNFSHQEPMPIEGTIEPANPHAITSDHTYSTLNLEDQFFSANSISSITPAERNEIEEKTRDQGKSNVWKSERTKRLTSSNFGRICTATERTNFPNLAYSLTKWTNAKSAALRHGIQYESTAVDRLEEDKNIKTTTCGLVVSLTHPYIAASPDHLLNDDTVVEVKCPYSAKNKKITHVSVPWLQMHNGVLQIDRGHNYFYQIQGQLFCTNRAKCLLVVYTLDDVKYILVERDEAFIAEMVTKLTDFYNNYFKQALLRRFCYKDYSSYTFQPSDIF